MLIFKWVIGLTLLLISCVQCGKILGVFPLASRSHYILGSSLLKSLAENGHDVTIICPYNEENPPKNGSYRSIVLTEFVEEHEARMKEMNIFEMGNMNLILIAPLISHMILSMVEQVFSHTNVQKLIHSNETFDVVIVEYMRNEAHFAFATHFNAPLIVFSPLGASSWINPLVGNPNPTSYVPDILTGYSSNMTFYQRFCNTLTYLFFQGLNNFYFLSKHNQLIQKYFPNSPDINDIIYNTSIVLLNSHPSTNNPVPSVPNMIDVGGYHVKPTKKLPKDLQNLLDNAEDGVIYFSLGSNVKSSLLPLEKRQAFINTFSKLKQKVLWKWEEDSLPGRPPNVYLRKWLPQQDILAHPNVKFFLTHSGLLSTVETIYHGVPILAIPIVADQKLNAAKMVTNGFGVRLNYEDVTEETLAEKIDELLKNPEYSKNAKGRSKVFHDRLVHPMDTVTYWVDYVIRHRGAPHLRVAGLDLPWYKYLLIDVILLVTLVTIIFTFLFCKITIIAFSCCKSKRQKLKVN